MYAKESNQMNPQTIQLLFKGKISAIPRAIVTAFAFCVFHTQFSSNYVVFFFCNNTVFCYEK